MAGAVITTFENRHVSITTEFREGIRFYTNCIQIDALDERDVTKYVYFNKEELEAMRDHISKVLAVWDATANRDLGDEQPDTES